MNVLLTSAGRRSYLVRYFREALGRNGKVFTSNSQEMVSSILDSDAFFLSPPVLDCSYSDFLFELCSRLKIDLIVPLIDVDVLVLSKLKAQLRMLNIEVLTPDAEISALCLDKLKTAAWLEEIGLPGPRTFEIENVADIDGKLDLPLVVKPRFGWGSQNQFIVHDKAELGAAVTIARKCLDRERSGKFEMQESFPGDLVAQEFASGREFALNVLSDRHGKLVHVSSVLKIRMRAGETECGAIVNQQPALETAAKIGKLLRSIGVIDIDVIEANERYLVLDINPRFGGSYPFVHESGTNYVKWIVNHYMQAEESELLLEGEEGKIFLKDISMRVMD